MAVLFRRKTLQGKKQNKTTKNNKTKAKQEKAILVLTWAIKSQCGGDRSRPLATTEGWFSLSGLPRKRLKRVDGHAVKLRGDEISCWIMSWSCFPWRIGNSFPLSSFFITRMVKLTTASMSATIFGGKTGMNENFPKRKKKERNEGRGKKAKMKHKSEKKETEDIHRPHRTGIRGHQHPWIPSRFPMVSHDTIVFFFSHLPTHIPQRSLSISTIYFMIIPFSRRFFYAAASSSVCRASEKHTAGADDVLLRPAREKKNRERKVKNRKQTWREWIEWKRTSGSKSLVYNLHSVPDFGTADVSHGTIEAITAHKNI